MTPAGGNLPSMLSHPLPHPVLPLPARSLLPSLPPSPPSLPLPPTLPLLLLLPSRQRLLGIRSPMHGDRLLLDFCCCQRCESSMIQKQTTGTGQVARGQTVRRTSRESCLQIQPHGITHIFKSQQAHLTSPALGHGLSALRIMIHLRCWNTTAIRRVS